MKKDKKKKKQPFIQVINGDTKSKAAKKSMELIKKKLKKMKKDKEKGKKYEDFL